MELCFHGMIVNLNNKCVFARNARSSCGRVGSTGPGSRPRGYGTLSTQPPTVYHHHRVERSLVCVKDRERISRSGLTQDIKMDSCVLQGDVPHQWIAQRQVRHMSVYCDGCHVLCLRHDIPVWQHIGQSTTATNRHVAIRPQMFKKRR